MAPLREVYSKRERGAPKNVGTALANPTLGVEAAIQKHRACGYVRRYDRP